MSERYDRLEKKLDEIVALLRILVLGNSDRHDYQPNTPMPNTPISPVLPIPKVQPFEATSSKCSKCGTEFSGICGYVCTDNACPMGLGPITVCENT